jgi:hypothetical protein
MSNDSEYGRPVLISVIGILNILLGVFVLVLGALGVMNFSEFVQILDEALVQAEVSGITGADLCTILGAGGLVLGMIYLIVGVGFWFGWAFFWYMSLIFWVLSLIGCIIMITVSPLAGIIGAVIFAVLVYYLFRPAVKAHFKI